MSPRLVLALLLAVAHAVPAFSQGKHTPPSGSAERKAICDAMRSYVVRKYSIGPLPKPIVFEVRRMVASQDFCSFQGVALFNDGSAAMTDYLPDVVYETGLEREGNG